MSMSLYVSVTTMVRLFICTGTVGTVGTLVLETLFFFTNMLLVLHWYYSLYVLVLWLLLVHWYQPLHNGTSHSMSMFLYVTCTTLVLHFICTGTLSMLVHWYQPLYFSVPMCYWYCTFTALYMYWHCGYCWYTSTSHSISPYQYVTSTGLYMYWHCVYCWYIGISHSMSLYQYVTGTSLVLIFICTGTVATVGTLVPVTRCLFGYMLLLPHWYCSLYVLVMWVLLIHWYKPLCFSLPICYWYCTGTGLYMYRYCGYCCYIGSQSMSLCL